MRITIVALNYGPEPTGIAPYTTRMTEGLRAAGHDVSVLTTFPHYPDWRLPSDVSWRRQEVIRGVPVHRLRHYVPRRPSSAARRAVSELSFGVRAVASRWHRPDVVICPSPALLSTAVALGRARVWDRPAFGVLVQDLYSNGVAEIGQPGPATRLLATVESRVLRRATGVAVIHDRFKEHVVDRLGVDEDAVAVIRNWTHVAPTPPFDRDEVRHALGWRPDETIVLHAGAMGEKQGLDNVVEAARIAEERRVPVRFVMVGNGGRRPRLEVLARGCTAIEFRDPLPEELYLKAMASADVLLVNERPGVREMAVPSKLTSYFSSGRPVLAATEADSITASEIEASGAGVVVAAGQPAALVEGVLGLVADPAMATALGTNGPTYCEAHLSEAKALAAYDAWVRRLYETQRDRSS